MRKSLALQQELGAIFDITFDLEDGAQVGLEKEALQLACELINSDENHFERIGVRVHDAQHPHFEADIKTLVQSSSDRIAYIVIPKIQSHQECRQAIDFVQHCSQGVSQRQIPIHVLIETQNALAEVNAIAALGSVECLSFGIMDFVSSHWGAIPSSAMRSPAQFSHPLIMRAKLEIAAACHRYGKVASHNVTTEFRDTAIVAGDASRAAQECAYTRMWSIHPSQIKPIVKALAPRSSEINDAIALLSAAQENKWGPIEFHGRLHDRASYRYYWAILKKAQMSQSQLPENASRFL